MNRKCLLLASMGLSWLTLSAAFTPEEARRIYDESSPTFSTSPFVEVGDYIFAEIKWSVDDQEDDEEADECEMSAILDAIEKYVDARVITCTNSPFSKALTTWLVPDAEFTLPEVLSTVVKDEDKDGEKCKVIAFDAGPLKAAKESAITASRKINERTQTDWLQSLVAAYENFKTPEEKRKFYVMLACPIVNFILSDGVYKAGKANEDEKGAVEEVERIANWEPSADSVFRKYPNMLWATHKESESNLFYPRWNEDDGGKFAEAKVLYRKGEDVPKILTLLAESICINPIVEKKWACLGGVLKALNKPEDAMIAYIQALKFNKDNPSCWKGVQDCCNELGMKSNYAGLDWYLKLKGFQKP